MTRHSVFARLIVAEYPDEWVRLSGESWGEAMAHRDDGVQQLVEWIADKSPDGALIGGSCFVYRQLHVHSALRGQALGARLVTHALLYLHRSLNDVAVLEALPIPSIWDEPEADGTRMIPPRTREVVGRLVRYYERLGFARNSRQVQRGAERQEAVAMWYAYAHTLPFHPLEGCEGR